MSEIHLLSTTFNKRFRTYNSYKGTVEMVTKNLKSQIFYRTTLSKTNNRRY